MTQLEEKSYEAFLVIRDFLTAEKQRKWDFLEVMTHLRNMIVNYENYKSGCPTGRHSSFCTCQPAIPGKGITDGQKIRKNNH